MLVIVSKFICFSFMAIMGLFVVKILCSYQGKLMSVRTFVLLGFLILFPMITYNSNYTSLYTLTVYLAMTITYKYIFDISFSKSFVCCSLIIVLLSIFDLINSAIWLNFVSLHQLRTVWYISLLSNFLISIAVIITVSFKKINTKLQVFISKIEYKRITKIIIFFILVTILLSIILYIITLDFKTKTVISTKMLIVLVLYLLVIILIKERNNYVSLCDEYDSLLGYVKVFEDWIENEQLNRHEYKNQLAVLRCMTKEKKVKDKIDDIINQNINIDSEMISQLRYLPSGGFKGLLYYKIIVARNKKVNIDINVNNDVGKQLNKLSKTELETISKLIGIYCDNAIEAATETRKKIVLIEIYEYNNVINIVISNTFNKKNFINNRNEKGVSTKGTGRGFGLYFANKLITKNKWIEEKQDIIDNFYIQKISIYTKK